MMSAHWPARCIPAWRLRLQALAAVVPSHYLPTVAACLEDPGLSGEAGTYVLLCAEQLLEEKRATMPFLKGDEQCKKSRRIY